MHRRCAGRGFTLVEVLITVVLVGIAGALVIPSMRSTGTLQVQAAVRTIVADITFVQSDALAFQSRRAIWFGRVPVRDAESGGWTFETGNGYTVAMVSGATLDLATDFMPDPDDPSRPYGRNFDDREYGGAVLGAASFDGDGVLIFDEMGGPVADLDGPDPGVGGQLEMAGSGQVFTLAVEPFTGQVTVTKTADADAE